MSSPTSMLSRCGLTAEKVRSLAGTPPPAQPAPKQPARWHPPVGEGKNLNLIRAWLQTAQPGDRVCCHDLGILPQSSLPAFRFFVRSGELSVLLRGKAGHKGHAAVYVKSKTRRRK